MPVVDNFCTNLWFLTNPKVTHGMDESVEQTFYYIKDGTRWLPIKSCGLCDQPLYWFTTGSKSVI